MTHLLRYLFPNLLHLFTESQFVRRTLGGDWVEAFDDTAGAFGSQGEWRWMRPEEADGFEVRGRESWPERGPR